MPSDRLYHVTPTANLKSILALGLLPRAGKWRGPISTRVPLDDKRRALDVFGRLARAAKPTVSDGFVHLPLKYNKLDFQTMANAGIQLPDGYVFEWPPAIFLATSIMAAYEVASNFATDGHHDSGPFSILSIHRSMIAGELTADPYIYINSCDHGLRLRRKRRGNDEGADPDIRHCHA